MHAEDGFQEARMEILVSKAFRPAAAEIKEAAVKTGMEWTSGVAPRQKHEREVIKTLVAMGEYQPSQGASEMDF